MLPKKIEKLPGLSNVTGRYTKKSPYESYSSTHNVANRIPISASTNSVKKSAVRSTSEEVVPSLFNSSYNKRKNDFLKTGKSTRLVSSTSLSPSRYETGLKTPSNSEIDSDFLSKEDNRLKKRPNNISSPSWSSSLSNAANNSSLSPCSASPCSVHYLNKYNSNSKESDLAEDESFGKKSSNFQIRPAGIIKPQVVGNKDTSSIHRNYQLPRNSEPNNESSDLGNLLPGLQHTQRILTQYIPYLLPESVTRFSNLSFPHSDSNLSSRQEPTKSQDSKIFEKQLKCLETRLVNIILQEDQENHEIPDDATPKPKNRNNSDSQPIVNDSADEILHQFSKAELDHLLQAVRVLLSYQSTQPSRTVVSEREKKLYQSSSSSTNSTINRSYNKNDQSDNKNNHLLNYKLNECPSQPGSEAMIKKLPIGFQNFSRYLDSKFGPDPSSGLKKPERHDTPLIGRNRINQIFWQPNQNYGEKKMERNQNLIPRQNSIENSRSSSSLRRTQSEPEHGDILLANQLNELSKNYSKMTANKGPLNNQQIYNEDFFDHNEFMQHNAVEIPTIVQPSVNPSQNQFLYHSHSATGYHSLPENTYYPNHMYTTHLNNPNICGRNGDYYNPAMRATAQEIYENQNRYRQGFYTRENINTIDNVYPGNMMGNLKNPNNANVMTPMMARNEPLIYNDRWPQKRILIPQNYPATYGRPLTRSGSSITPGSIKNFIIQNRYGSFVPMMVNYETTPYATRKNYPNSNLLYPTDQMFPTMNRQGPVYHLDNYIDQDSSPVVCMIPNSLSATDLAAMQSSSLSVVNSSSTDNLNSLLNRRAITPNQELYEGIYTGLAASRMQKNQGRDNSSQRIGDLAAQGGYIINNIAPQDPLLILPNQNAMYNNIQELLEKEMTTDFPLIKGWTQQRTNTGRMFYAYSGQETKFKNLIETTTWDHPVISPQIPLCWERVDTIREGVYYRNMLIPHCQRHHPSLWIKTDLKNTNLEKSQWFIDLCDLQNSLKYRVMNGLMPIVDNFKNNKDERDEKNYLHHFTCMEYNDLVQVLHHLDRLFYMELRELVVKFERKRYLIAESMFMQEPVREIFSNTNEVLKSS